MNWLDFLIIAVLFLSSFWSFRRGFILELFLFISLIIGLLSAVIFYPQAAPLFENFLSGQQTINIFSFATMFIGTAAVCYICGLFIHKFIYFIKLGILDRLLGAFVGFLKALVVIVVLLVSIAATSAGQPPAYLKNSMFSRPLVAASKGTMDNIPLIFNNVKEDYGSQLEKWLETVRNRTG
ncbi:MAG: CvpA family protein [bacterium]